MTLNQKIDQVYLRPQISDDFDTVHCVDFSSNAEQIVAGCGDGSIRLYQSAAGRRLFRLFNNKSPVTAVQFKPQSDPSNPPLITAAQANGIITKWHAGRGVQIQEQQLQTELYTLKYSRDGQYFATAGKDRKVHVFSDSTSTEMITLQNGNSEFGTVGHNNRIFAVEFDEVNSNLIYSAGWDNTIEIFDIRAGYSVQSIHDVQVCGDALDVFEDKLLAGSWNAEDSIKIFDLRQTEQELANIREVKYDYSKPFDEQAQLKITIVPELFRFDFNEKESHYQINKMPSYVELIEKQLHDAEKDDNTGESGKLDYKADDLALKKTETTDEDEATLLYTAKFNRASPQLIVAGGSGGNMLKVIDWNQAKTIASTRAEGSIFDCCVSQDGRFGAFCGSGFGLQIFGFPEELGEKEGNQAGDSEK